MPRVDPTSSQWQSRLLDLEKESISWGGGGLLKWRLRLPFGLLSRLKPLVLMGFMRGFFKSFGKKKGRTGYMALKIDLEKAYDKLEWSFIRDMLIRVNLPMDIIDLIMSCVSTVSKSILFNGEALDPIFPSRGIRQGDPISPYLFILCMDYLRQLIEEKCSENLW